MTIEEAVSFFESKMGNVEILSIYESDEHYIFNLGKDGQIIFGGSYMLNKTTKKISSFNPVVSITTDELKTIKKIK